MQDLAKKKQNTCVIGFFLVTVQRFFAYVLARANAHEDLTE
jgi:hypothetical protein